MISKVSGLKDTQETLNYIFAVVVFQRLQSLKVLRADEGWVRRRNETESVVEWQECQLAE